MSNQYKEWTKEEIQFLKDNYKIMTDEEISVVLNKSVGGVSAKRKKLKLKRERPLVKYSEEEAKNQLKNIFDKINRPPTKEDGKLFKMKPARDWYVDHYGSIENACVYFGLIEKPLTQEERINISIKELKEIAKKLNKIPSVIEYEEMRTKGYSKYPLVEHLGMTYTEICDKYLFNYKDIIPNGYYRCSVCQEIKPLNEFNVDNDREVGITSSCKLCNYFKRNKLVIPERWSKEECIVVIDYILNEKISFINELCDLVPHKKLEDFIDLLSNKIKIANKPLNIKTYCEYCGKEEIKNLSIYLKNINYFCSLDCYWKHKKENSLLGENNEYYNRIKTNCTNCNKDIEIIPYDFNKTNSNGDNHNFCSQECYWEYRKKYYIGENHPHFGVEKTEEQKRKQRIITTKLYTDGIFKRLTKPQRIVNSILEELNIKNEQEYNCKYYSIDNYLSDYNLMIEVMGDYFHSNPLKFKAINNMQHKDIIRDKKKRTYIRRYKNINILYLWETDINKNIDLVKSLILKYINNNGILEEYNSFNYSFNDGILSIKDTLIKPYVDYSAEELNKINKEKKKSA